MWFNLLTVCVVFVVVTVVFVLMDFYEENTQRKSNPPHIIFILIDDLGWNDVSFHGSPQIPTPNIDALAANGIILHNYYTHPQCTPSRAALLTGKYANRLGLQHFVLLATDPFGLSLKERTLPQHLKRLGYKTHLVGKWHLGHHKTEYMPTRRGFDTFFGYVNGFIDYYDYSLCGTKAEYRGKVYVNFGADIWENETPLINFRGEYATDVFTKKAVDIISKHNTDSPLFLELAHLAVHVGNRFSPLQAPPKYVARNKHIKDLKRRTYAGVVSSMDESIGKIFEALRSKQMLNNTIVVISSDNGGSAAGNNNGRGTNWPLRGMKFHLWEGGVRIVGLTWSPLFQLEKPRVFAHLMHMTDWLPTFYEAAGGNLKDLGDIDGLSAWKTLTKKDALHPRKEIFLTVDRYHSMASLRKSDMKLVLGAYSETENGWYGPTGTEDGIKVESLDEWVWRNGSKVKDILIDSGHWIVKEKDAWRKSVSVTCGESFNPEKGNCDFMKKPCLYNITEDPCEFRNIASFYPEIVSSMMYRIKELNSSTITPFLSNRDPRGDPRCHNFSYERWLDPERISTCPWL